MHTRCRGGAWGTLIGVGLAMLVPPTPAAAAPVVRVARLGPAPAGQPIGLVLPLAADHAGLRRLALAVTTPGSPQYGHYQQIPALARSFGASARTRREVVAYLRRVGATGVRIDATGLFADATVTAALAERLFHARLARFQAPRQGSFTAPTAPVVVPGALRGLVTGVVGLDTRPLAKAAGAGPGAGGEIEAHAAAQPSSGQRRTGTPRGCAAGVVAGEQKGDPATAGFTPNQYLTAYGFDPLRVAGLDGAGERVALIEIDGFRYGDLRTFAQCFALDIPALDVFDVGLRKPLPPGGESTLDLEVLDAAAPDLEAIDVYETNANAANTLRALTAPLQSRRYRPQVISASLGLCEPAVLSAVGVPGIQATEAALEMAAIGGITFLASSGDQGSADCTAPDGLPLDRLAVNYPASSPWATGVGGTSVVLNAANEIVSQLAWNDAGEQPGSAGGGGSSELFRRPGYQRGTVRANRRGVPDVSMLADVIPGFAVYCSAQVDCIDPMQSDPWQSVGGTSAATPLLAGGLALVDQALRLHHRLDLGLADPLLYRLGRSSLASQVFDDVRAYGNDVGPFIAGRGLGCCTAGPGYDMASGWGSVDLALFESAALAMQPPQFSLSLPRHQHSLARRAILARVSCADACRLAAAAEVRIGSARPFQADSRVYTLTAAGVKTVKIRFSRSQLARLRAAERQHRRVVATVYGLLIIGARTVQAQTLGRRLTLVR